MLQMEKKWTKKGIEWSWYTQTGSDLPEITPSDFKINTAFPENAQIL